MLWPFAASCGDVQRKKCIVGKQRVWNKTRNETCLAGQSLEIQQAHFLLLYSFAALQELYTTLSGERREVDFNKYQYEVCEK